MKRELETAIAAVVQQYYDVAPVIDLTRPDAAFGDYSTNIALQLAKTVGKNPREIAETLAAAVSALPIVATASVAGPGFVNLTLSDEALVQLAVEEPAKTMEGKTVLVEYSDPNPFKPLHAGHLYTTLVGDTIARLVVNAGAKTVRLNFGGDVGLHVAKSMWAITKELGGENPDKLTQIAIEQRPSWLGARYVAGNNAYEDDEQARAEIVAINKRVYSLHNDNDHDSAFAQIYWTCRQWSYDYFAVLYQQLQVAPFDRYIPESEVTQLGLQTVREQLERGVYQKSGDAVVFDGEAQGLHTRVFINSEGLPTYEAKDVGLSLTKWRDYTFDESIIITANEQAQYMQVVLASIAQFEPEASKRTKHLTHGVVKLQGGVKMSSRKGNVVTALEILDAARAAGEATGTNPTEDTILAAVKYAFVRSRIGSDIAYDPIESIALEGNSGPYLQYAHARARSILAKVPDATAVQLVGLDPAERKLLQKLSEYSEVVTRATSELMPHHICTYLYELAQEFNRFYEHNRVVDDPRQAIRLSLVGAYADKLQAGLTLLGITAPDTM